MRDEVTEIKFLPALRHTVTLTFDPVNLIFCGTSSVTRSNHVPNLNEIEQSAADFKFGSGPDALDFM